MGQEWKTVIKYSWNNSRTKSAPRTS